MICPRCKKEVTLDIHNTVYRSDTEAYHLLCWQELVESEGFIPLTADMTRREYYAVVMKKRTRLLAFDWESYSFFPLLKEDNEEVWLACLIDDLSAAQEVAENNPRAEVKTYLLIEKPNKEL